MTTVYIRSLKYNYAIDCSFHVLNGREYVNGESYHVGDEVVLMFTVDKKKADGINVMEGEGLKTYPEYILTDNNRYTVSIPFVVTERRHALTWQEIGQLQELSHDIFLQAKSGYWEDVFKWVCMGEPPPWIDEDDGEAK